MKTEKITREKLIRLGFERIEMDYEMIYVRGGYGLKELSGSWQVWANNFGQPTPAMPVLDTIEDLERDYFETTGINLM